MSEVAAARTRTVVVTYLGAIVRRLGDWMPIAGTVELLGQCGLDAPSVRTAVFRLKKRGWLESDSRDSRRGYALSPTALSLLAAGDNIVWHVRPAADLADGWCVVHVSVPESARTKRQQLRAHLSSLGFGNIGTALWLAPARMCSAAEQAIAELGLTAHCAIFVGDYAGGQDLTALLHASWDFARIDEHYREFIDRFATVADDVGASVNGQQAFVGYLDVIDHWRRLAYRDPGLPPEVLADAWSAPRAGAVYEQLVTRLEGPALAHCARFW